MSLILPNSNDFSKMSKEAGTPLPTPQPQAIPIDQIIIQISAQVAGKIFEEAIKPYEDRIKKLEEMLNNQKEDNKNDNDCM